MKPTKHWVPYLLIAALLVALDQSVKHWVRGNIPLYGSMEFLPGLMDLTYVQNTGAAFSLLSEHTWLLTCVSGLAVLLVSALLCRGYFPDVLGRVALCLVLAGAAGNLIDRALNGYVVDMFRLLFLDFAVFNVADIFVCCGGVLLCAYILLVWPKREGKAL